jgi:metal-responsive CopG/Arc/MetJ family transcriptional regulator
MKTAISLPDALFAKVEQHSAGLPGGRSEFFQRAAELLLHKLADESLTEQIDAALALTGPDDANAEFTREAAHRTLGAGSEDW